MATVPAALAALRAEPHIDYPTRDGRPMGETDLHRAQMIDAIETLELFFAGQRVYVSGNILVFPVQGKPRNFVVPDTLVAKGLSPQRRRIFKVWVEGKTPDVVIETTSRKTKTKDTTTKPKLYARIGVKEYFLFDPTEDYLDPPLQGYRLAGKKFVPLVPADDGSLVSAELELRLCKEEGSLQFYRLDNDERLLSPSEARQAEATKRRAEAMRRRIAERAQREALEAKLAAVEGQSKAIEAQRDAEQKLQAEAAARQAEAAARHAAEAEVARLREQLKNNR